MKKVMSAVICSLALFVFIAATANAAALTTDNDDESITLGEVFGSSLEVSVAESFDEIFKELRTYEVINAALMPARSTYKHDLTIVLIGAGAGALLGAVFDGNDGAGRGALIGAAVGIGYVIAVRF